MHCKTFHILQVNPAETWLRNDGSDLAYFPKADGTFDLSDVSQYCILTVEGPLLSSPLPSRSSNTARSISVSSTPSLPGPSTSMPGFHSVVAPKRPPTCTVKVVKANIVKAYRRKPEFVNISQTFVEVMESTANVTYVLGIIHKRWGQQYTLVTNDGIELADDSSTQG